ncbi:MAG: HAD hydrolase family protein, partial [Oscillospiraceae bacterium]
MTQQIADALDMALVGKAEVLVSDKQVIDITPKGVNKAVTLLKVAESLGVSPEEIMAFGDTSSDISMIKAAGIGVCTANGTPDALAVADLIAPSNNDDGVADIIERYVLV